MRLSRYVAWPDSATAEWAVAVNLANGAVVRVSKHVLTALTGQGGAGSISVPAGVWDRLYAMGFLVGNDVDEGEFIRYWIRSLCYGTHRLSVYLLLTYGCNMACGYCYEGSLTRTPTMMSLEIAERVVDWIQRQVRLHGFKVVDLTFFGGEPLLNVELLRWIAEIVRRKCYSQKIFFSLVTNGTLLSRQTVETLKQVALNVVQVTLDGPQQTHDVLRPFRDGSGSFSRVLSGIATLLDCWPECHVTLNVNVCSANRESLPQLLTVLRGMGLGSRVVLHFSPVLHGNPTCGTHNASLVMSTADLRTAFCELYTMAVDQGFVIAPRNLIKAGACTAKSKGGFVVDPNGDVFKCPTGVGLGQFRIGHVTDEEVALEQRASAFVGNEPWDQDSCLECTYVPLCLGGCRFQRWLCSHDLKGSYCLKPFYETLVQISRYIYDMEGSHMGRLAASARTKV